MDSKVVIERVKNLFYAIISNLDNVEKQKQDFDFKCRDLGEYNNELQKYPFQFPPVILNYKHISNKTLDLKFIICPL